MVMDVVDEGSSSHGNDPSSSADDVASSCNVGDLQTLVLVSQEVVNLLACYFAMVLREGEASPYGNEELRNGCLLDSLFYGLSAIHQFFDSLCVVCRD